MDTCACKPISDEGFDHGPVVQILEQHQSGPGLLVSVLQGIQAAYGFLPKPALARTALALDVPLPVVLGVATFYAQFCLEPRGDHVVRICHGTACHVKGATDITRAIVSELGVALGETASDLSVTVESVACVGCCGLAPVVLVDDTTHGMLDARSARKLARGTRRST